MSYKTISLERYAKDGDTLEEGVVGVPFNGLPAPNAVENLRKLDRLGLLTGEVVLGLIGQAPIDPLGVYGALKHIGAWAFNPLDCTMIQVLAKKGDKPVALMRIDLLSDDIVFVTLQSGKLAEFSQIPSVEMGAKLREEGMNESRIMSWIKGCIDEAIQAGMAGR